VQDFLTNSDRCALHVLRQPKSSPTRWGNGSPPAPST